jgi:transcriptional regulator with XRE-family HTH domain
VRQALVSSIEVAKANPTIESLDRIAAALGVDVADLLNGQEEPKRIARP